MMEQTLEKNKNRGKSRIIRAFNAKRTIIDVPRTTVKESTRPPAPKYTLPEFIEPKHDLVVDAINTLQLHRNGMLEGLPMTVDAANCILNIGIEERARDRKLDTQDGFLL